MDETVAVLGLGLMGGSLAMALRRRPGVRVQAYARREATRAEAARRGAADAVFATAAEAVHGAGLVVACVPVERIPVLIEAALPGLDTGAAVTDVGSTKGWVETESRRVLARHGACFVGSHPVAGSERQGLESARADLYEDAVTVVTEGDAAAVTRVERLWTGVGCRVLRMTADEHDRILARTSHLPHLAAAALARASARGVGPGAGRLCGPGFRDATRIADGDPELWREIVRTNRAAIRAALEDLAGDLAQMAEAIRTADDDGLTALLAEGRAARRSLLAARSTLRASDGDPGAAP